MPARALPPAIGATEKALRPLLTHALAGSLIGGYDEWVYLNVHERADDPARVEELVADALKQPREVAAAARTRLVDAGLLDTEGSLTGPGREQLKRCRDTVTEITQALTACNAAAMGVGRCSTLGELTVIDEGSTPVMRRRDGSRRGLRDHRGAPGPAPGIRAR